MPESNSDLWGDIFKLALAWGVNEQANQRADRPPSFFNVPLTPEQKRVEDEKWRVYQAGGSDTQKTVQGLAKQFLSGQQGAPPSFSFLSPEMKGQTFAGGLRMPTFDFSKLPTTPTTTTPAPVFQPGPGTSPIKNNPSGTPAGAIHTKLPTETGYVSPIGGTPVENAWNGGAGPTMDPLEMGRDDPRLWFNGGGMNWSEGGAPLQAMRDWWGDFQQKHPNWATYGPKVIEAALAAQFGIVGAGAGRFLRWLLEGSNPNRGAAAPPPPGAGGSAPGFIPIGGAPGNTVRP